VLKRLAVAKHLMISIEIRLSFRLSLLSDDGGFTRLETTSAEVIFFF
jgi:hypothetical protein